jgi:hypothetical protein
VVIAWDHRDPGVLLGVGLEGKSYQVANRAGRQAELASDLGRGGPETGHPSDGHSEREFGGAWHRERLPELGTEGLPGLYPTAESHETFASGFRTEHSVR